MRVLIAEDDAVSRRVLEVFLAKWGHEVVTTQDGAEAWQALSGEDAPQLAILDWMMPRMDGIEICRRVRGQSAEPYVYILLLTAKGQKQDVVEGIDAGADDYLTKPFGLNELLARVRVALRHAAHTGQDSTGSIFSAGDLQVDLARRQVLVSGSEVHLTPIEYKLLMTLVQNAGKVLTHRQMLTAVWGPGYENESNYLRVHMTQLRHKLEKDPTRPRYLVTELGVGYRLRAD
jgi:two-component system, OmpR family, KDP operon response regulator KdpE